MNRDVADRWCERVILGLALAALILLPLIFGGRPQSATGTFLGPVLADPFVVAEWLTLGLAVTWLVRLWIKPQTRLLWTPVCWVVVAFSAYAIARYFTADIEYVARQEVLKVLLYAFFFFVVINNLHRQETTQIISLTMIFLGMAISFYALYQYLADSNRVWHVLKPYSGRASGTYISPNHLAGFLEMMLPLGLAYTLMSRFRTLYKVFFGYASLVMVGGIAVTVSRGSWIAITLALLFFFAVLYFNGTYRLPALVFLVLVVAAGVLFIPRSSSMETRLKQMLQPKKAEDDTRFALWGPAVKVWQENVWWGVGPAHFDSRFRQHRPEIVQLRPDRAHNDYLNTLADWGVVGVALVASAWVLLGIGAWKTWGFVKRSPGDLGGKRTSSKFAFVLGASTGLLAILFHSVVDFNMHIPANALLAVTLIALLSSHLRFATERYWVKVGVPVRIAASLVVVAVAALFACQGLRKTSENVWLAKAYVTPPFSAKRVGFLKEAFRVEPANALTAYGIGEALRIQSSEGAPGYEELTKEAMTWFERGMKLNPWNGDSFLGYGWCLDWLDRGAESGQYFMRAEELDPNSYFTAARIGYHLVQVGKLAAARALFERSMRLQYHDNPIAHSYVRIIRDRLLEAAAAKPLNLKP